MGNIFMDLNSRDYKVPIHATLQRGASCARNMPLTVNPVYFRVHTGKHWACNGKRYYCVILTSITPPTTRDIHSVSRDPSQRRGVAIEWAGCFSKFRALYCIHIACPMDSMCGLYDGVDPMRDRMFKSRNRGFCPYKCGHTAWFTAWFSPNFLGEYLTSILRELPPQ